MEKDSGGGEALELSCPTKQIASTWGTWQASC